MKNTFLFIPFTQGHNNTRNLVSKCLFNKIKMKRKLECYKEFELGSFVRLINKLNFHKNQDTKLFAI